MTDVIAHDGELLAVGWNGVGHGDAGRAVSWSSADGEHWTFHDPTDTSFGGTYHFPTRLAHAPSGDVILVSGVGLGAGATIWVTSDGRQWTDRSVAAWEMTSIHDLAASDTVLVAIGMQFLADGGPRPQAWISSDAQEWTAVALPPEIGTLAGVTYDAVRDRFLLVGSDVRDRPTVWLTEDGRGWASTRFAGERGAVLDVEANEDGLIVAVGGLGEADEPEGQQAVAWASHDGVTWSINEFADAPRLSLVAVGARVLAHSGWPDQPRTWVGEPR